MKPVFQSTKVIELGSCAFRQWRASQSHCKYLHGYQLKAKLWFNGSSLDDKNWVVDFGGLKELKALLQSIYDHTTTVAADDPELNTFKALNDKGIIQLQILEGGVGIERAAENVFTIADKYVRNLTNGRCWVDKVEVFEHEENSATYSQEQAATQTQSFRVDIQPTILDSTFEIGSSMTQNTVTMGSTTPGENIAKVQPVDDTPAPGRMTSRGAVVGNAVTSGMGNLFGGTSWGN
jgi:6-pyruvoyltetrahydropterin/6-carboxytetrahydropterin synthase